MAIKNIITIGILLSAGLAHAELPHTFTAGTPALASEVNKNFQYLDEQLQDLDKQLSSTANKYAVKIGGLEVGYTYVSDSYNHANAYAGIVAIYNDDYYGFWIYRNTRTFSNSIYFKNADCTGDAYYRVSSPDSAKVAINNLKKGIFFHENNSTFNIYFHEKDPTLLSTTSFSYASYSNGQECSNSSSNNNKGVYIKLKPYAEHNGLLDDLPWLHDPNLYNEIKNGEIRIGNKAIETKSTQSWDGN